MAAIVSYGNGLRRLEFSLTPNGQRRALRLGKVSAKVAEGWKAKVEAIIADRILGRPHEAETATWLASMDDGMLARLRRAGLTAATQGLTEVTVGVFLDEYIASRGDTKATTRTVYGRVRRHLLAYFPAETRLRDIAPADAEAWRIHLLTVEKLADNTVRRSIGVARQFWHAASKRKLVAENPFSGLNAAVRPNKARWRFVTQDEAQRVLDACPDATWRLLFALARFGGLRIPSEACGLRWQDIDFARGRIRVTAPKTEHHDGGVREVPLFPELRPYVEDAHELADEGAEYIFADRFRQRQTAMNLRTTLSKIIRRAGLPVWPRLWVNLRASRATELVQAFPSHVAAAWLGHTPATAATFYQQVRDSDFERALQPALGQAQQKAQQPAAEWASRPETVKTGDGANSAENTGNDDIRPLVATAGEVDRWALQDSNL